MPTTSTPVPVGAAVSIAHPLKGNGCVTLADSVGVSTVVTDVLATTVTVTEVVFHELAKCDERIRTWIWYCPFASPLIVKENPEFVIRELPRSVATLGRDNPYVAWPRYVAFEPLQLTGHVQISTMLTPGPSAGLPTCVSVAEWPGGYQLPDQRQT